MGRPKRAAEGGLIYHVLNRANARMTIVENDGDYEAFERVLEEAVGRSKTRLLAYCVMPNHWHLVLWPQDDGELSDFTDWRQLNGTGLIWVAVHDERKTVSAVHDERKTVSATVLNLVNS